VTNLDILLNCPKIAIPTGFSSRSTAFHRLAPRMGVVSALAQDYIP